jgi:hypothetical protein
MEMTTTLHLNMFICSLLDNPSLLSPFQHFSSQGILKYHKSHLELWGPPPRTNTVSHLDGQACGSQPVSVALAEAVLAHQRGEVLQALHVPLRCSDVQQVVSILIVNFVQIVCR